MAGCSHGPSLLPAPSRQVGPRRRAPAQSSLAPERTAKVAAAGPPMGANADQLSLDPALRCLCAQTLVLPRMAALTARELIAGPTRRQTCSFCQPSQPPRRTLQQHTTRRLWLGRLPSCLQHDFLLHEPHERAALEKEPHERERAPSTLGEGGHVSHDGGDLPSWPQSLVSTPLCLTDSGRSEMLWCHLDCRTCPDGTGSEVGSDRLAGAKRGSRRASHATPECCLLQAPNQNRAAA